jgi:hypothetical protein
MAELMVCDLKIAEVQKDQKDFSDSHQESLEKKNGVAATLRSHEAEVRKLNNLKSEKADEQRIVKEKIFELRNGAMNKNRQIEQTQNLIKAKETLLVDLQAKITKSESIIAKHHQTIETANS